MEVEEDMEVQGDLRTTRVLVDIANSIFDFLQITADCTSLHYRKWMPNLDLEVRVAGNNTINFQFYSKPCSSKFLMMNSSAMSARVKMVSLGGAEERCKCICKHLALFHPESQGGKFQHPSGVHF